MKRGEEGEGGEEGLGGEEGGGAYRGAMHNSLWSNVAEAPCSHLPIHGDPQGKLLLIFFT